MVDEAVAVEGRAAGQVGGRVVQAGLDGGPGGLQADRVGAGRLGLGPGRLEGAHQQSRRRQVVERDERPGDDTMRVLDVGIRRLVSSAE